MRNVKRNPGRVLAALGLAAIIISCSENLPTGPAVFSGIILRYTTSHDTIVVGDTSLAVAGASDASGNQVQNLTFDWTTSNAAVVELGTPSSGDGAAGRVKTLIARKTGQSVVTMTLPDPRFNTSPVGRTQTVVVGGVRILTTHDSTLTAINDTGRAIAAGLVKQNGALVTRVSQGVKWTRKGTHTSIVGSGDTIRYVALSNGVDTLIASHDFCLLGAKCADTAIVRISQQLSLSLSTRQFQVWSFSDSTAPAVTLADRRGTGLAGTTIQFVPILPADSTVVRISPVLGASNFATGAMATPRIISTGNGTARVAVRAIGADGVTVIATDTITETVRQVARRLSVLPLRATVSVIDSIPIAAIAQDARGLTIADATLGINSTGLVRNGVWVGPHPVSSIGTQGTLTASIFGVAAVESNPSAPQIPATVDQSVITLAGVDTVKADVARRTYSFSVLNPGAVPAAGSWVRFRASSGASPDSVQVNAFGTATVDWTLPFLAQSYTLTGVRSTSGNPLATLADSSGQVVLRRSVVVIPAAPDTATSSVAVGSTTVAANATTTINITLRDFASNLATNATASDFTISVARGTVTGMSCTAGVCSATYTAPATSGSDTITVQIAGVNVLNSPVTITIP